MRGIVIGYCYRRYRSDLLKLTKWLNRVDSLKPYSFMTLSMESWRDLWSTREAYESTWRVDKTHIRVLEKLSTLRSDFPVSFCYNRFIPVASTIALPTLGKPRGHADNKVIGWGPSLASSTCAHDAWILIHDNVIPHLHIRDHYSSVRTPVPTVSRK